MLSFLHKKIFSLWNIIKLQKRLDVFGVIFLFTLFVSGWFLSTCLTHASITDSIKDLSLALSDLTLWMAGLFLKLTIFVLKFVIEIGGYNGYLDSQAVTVGWVMVRDIVNMGFVVILLVIAFGTILGLEQYEWKKMIVKFILAAILVNFSRTICGLIIDAAQVVMITFVNGVAATAGGNLIGAFHADKIMSLSNDTTSIGIDPQAVFVATTAALMFAVMMLVTMSIYLIILLFRMISLWVLIVLSPMAFVASVIPQTQKYASEWWKEFINNVISGPLLIFFLWLSFVTIGSGQVHNQISDPKYNSLPASALISGESSTALQDIQGVGQSAGIGNNTAQSATAAAGITSVMTWDSMANFFIALAMLLVGAKKAQELGVMGSSMLGKVSDIGKKAFLVASGVGTGLWAARQVGKGAQQVGKGLGVAAGALGTAALWATPYEQIKNAALGQIEGIKSWSARNPDQVIRTQVKMKEEMINGVATGKMVEDLDERGEKQYVPVYKKDAQGKDTDELDWLNPDEIAEQRKNIPLAGLQARIYKSRMKKTESRKKLKRNTDFAKGREDLMNAYATAKPSYLLQGKDEKFDALDRMEGGILEAMKARSEGKTKDFRSMGRKFAASQGRVKYKGGVRVEDTRGTLTQQTVVHDTRAALHEASLAQGKEKAMREYAEGREPWTNKWTQGVGGGPKVHEIIAKLKLETEEAKKARESLESGWTEKAAAGRPDLMAQIAAAEISKKTADTNLEQLKSRGKFFATEARGKELAEAELAKKAADARLQRLEAEHNTAAAADMPSLMTAIAEAELQKKKADSKLEAIKSIEKTTATATLEGESKEIAEAELAKKAADARLQELESQRAKEMAGTEVGKSFLSLINDSEMGKKAAEDFVKGVKEKDLEVKFKSATDAVEQIIKSGESAGNDADTIRTAMENSAKSNAFIASLNEAAKLKETLDEKGIREKQATTSVYDAAIGLSQGSRTPSLALSEASDNQQKIYSRLERTQAQKLAADRIAFLTQKRTDQGGRLDLRDQIALNAACNAVDAEAWNDDVYDHIFEQIRRLTSDNGGPDPTLTAAELKKARSMQALAVSMEWQFDSKNRKINSSYGRKMSAQFQNLGIFGDAKVVRGHNLVEERVETVKKEKSQEFASERKSKVLNLTRSIKRDDQGEYVNIVRSALGEKKLQELQANANTNGLTLVQAVSREDKSVGGQPSVKDKVETSLSGYVSSQIEKQESAIITQLTDYASIVKGMNDVLLDRVQLTASQYLQKIADSQDFLTTAARQYTKDAYGNKHYESAHNQQFDPRLGMLRPMSVSEAEGETKADMAKMKVFELAAAQIHSFGDMDLNSHLLSHIDEGMYRTILGQIQEEYQMNQVVLRTMKKLYGYTSEEDVKRRTTADGRTLARLGGSEMDKTASAGPVDSAERGVHIIKDYLVPSLLGHDKSFLYGLKNLFNNIKLGEANKGKLNIDVDHYGEVSDIGSLIETIKKHSELSDAIGPKDLERLEQKWKQAQTTQGLGIADKGKSTGTGKRATASQPVQ